MWRDPTPPEWLALVAGLKPALRIQREPRRALAEAAAARRRGFAVEVVELPTRVIVYVAATPAAARELRALEAAALPGQPARSEVRFDPAPHVGLGLALGFPRCCIDAFIARIARGADVDVDGRHAHEDHLAAVEALARSRHLDARANVFARDRTGGWVSHVPCAFDCAPSLAYADRVIAAYRAHDAAGAGVIATRLALAVAIERDGERRAPADASADACVLAFAVPA